MKLLSVHFGSHDSNISYFDGEELHYIKSERKHKRKHHSWRNIWEWCDDIKEIWGISLGDVDDLCCFLDEGSYPQLSFKTGISDIFPERKLFIESGFLKENTIKMHHHYGHALSAWMFCQSPDLQIVFDGYDGKLDNNSWHVFKNNQVVSKGSWKFNGSIGISMEELGEFMRIRHNPQMKVDIPGKLMSLQSFGTPQKQFVDYLCQYEMEQIKEVFNPSLWVQYKGDETVASKTELDWLASVHEAVGEILLKFFKRFANKDDTIVYAGGVAQNVVWNTKLKQHFPNLIIPPHCGDEGLSLGGIEWLRRKHNLPKFKLANFPYSQQDESPEEPSLETIKKAAKLLAEGNPIGWYQGNGEIGPRALGNRSILMDPRILNGKQVINKIKNRENYRPFGASVLEEHTKEYFDIDYISPHMLYVCPVKKQNMPAITHIDGTCRIQTVGNDNEVYRKLLQEFYNLTGCAVLLNTSLNVSGSGIAGTKKEAYKILYETELTHLVIGDKIEFCDKLLYS